MLLFFVSKLGTNNAVKHVTIFRRHIDRRDPRNNSIGIIENIMIYYLKETSGVFISHVVVDIVVVIIIILIIISINNSYTYF